MGETVRVGNAGGRSVLLMDSIAYVEASDAGQIVIAGSHGGRSSGRFAIEYALGACFLNDAGGGKDHAGVASFADFDRIAVPAAAYSHLSARIGDAQDAWDHGVLSRVNETAAALGFVAGEPLQAAIHRVFGQRTPQHRSTHVSA